MIHDPAGSWRVAVWLVEIGVVCVLLAALVLVSGRTLQAMRRVRQRRLERRYAAPVRRALDGDEAAVRMLVASPGRHRIGILTLLITPLIEDRDPARIARTREMAEALSVVPRADQYLGSVWWWRRALALRVFGLLQVRDRTARLIAALDDPHPDVRAAALDALTDLRDPASLQAVLVRMHDSSLHRGRRAAAVAAFGRACEPFLLDLAAIDRTRRANYARALAVCGTEASRPALREWARDRNPLVRAAAFEALGRVGLDEAAAQLALDGLDDIEDVVRRAAVRALRGWRGGSESVGRLALHLTDSWTVAVAAAECLRSMGAPGLAALKVSAERPDLAGVLARQMLWEDERVR